MAIGAARPSDRLAPERWEQSRQRLVETVRSLIRIPSINPPDPPGGELEAARWIAGALEEAGIPATIHEPVPGRGSVTARLHGDGTGGPPLLLMSHLDVVPAPPEGWTHDPFAAEVQDGWIYGRGAVDMKDLVAMEIEVMRLLAEEARAAGRDPSRDPVPGLTRDVLFASVADEEAGGLNGAAYLAMEEPDTVRAAAAINEAGGVAVDIGSRRLYPIQVGEKGISVFRLTFNGIWGHASMPRKENANLLAAEAVTRLAAPWPARLTEITRALLERTIEAFDGTGDLPDEAIRLLRAAASGDGRVSALALQGICLPVYTRVLDAMLRDTLSPNILHGGVKFNIVPGTASLEVDVRRLPGSTEEEVEERIRERLGPELSAVTDIEVLISSEPLIHRYDDPNGLYPVLEAVLRDHDPGAVPVPAMAPFGTDAKHLLDLGVPTFGFSPLRQPPGETYIERWHGIDERVSIEGLRWGLPVLYDAVRRFCGTT